jgi:hypothetical protein
MIAIQYRCPIGPTAGTWVDAPVDPFPNGPEAITWCQHLYEHLDPIAWAYAPDTRVVMRADFLTAQVVVAEFYAVRQPPRLYAS